MEKVDAIVVGAGVVGLATARALARAGRETLVLEAESLIGSGTSSRNSEVIHAGIYYPKGSLKARACVAGRERLYRYAASRGIPHKKTGKLIVATEPAEIPIIEKLKLAAAGNDVDDLAMLSRAEAVALEPALSCVGALLSPSTGIVDSHQLMLAYQGEAEARGATVAFETPFERARVVDRGLRVVAGGIEIETRVLVNSAGLAAQRVARTIDGLAGTAIPEPWFVKGNYFMLEGKPPFSRLIYPVPAHAGLGVHVTVDLGGRVRFGPDTEEISALDYDVDPKRGDLFYDAIRRYYPALRDGTIKPAYAGIRPKLASAKTGNADFVVSGPKDHGIGGLVSLFGIESPGLTASLALADEVLLALGIEPPRDD